MLSRVADLDPRPDRHRLTRTEVEILRRSVGASGQLPRGELDRLLAETVRLLAEREALAEVLDGLGPSWRDLRRALNDLHRVLHTPEAPDGAA